MKKKDSSKERNFYDRIFKENAEYIFIILIQQELGMEINNYKILPEKITKTVEREMDFCYLINEGSKNEFILHLEFQSRNDKEMLYRMARYHGLAFAKHKVPIKHVVIHLGNAKPNMRSKLRPAEIFSDFDIINIRALDARTLLSSQVPEIIIMALLASYPKKDTEVLLRYIVQKLKIASKSEKDLDKYITQLLFFSRLRNLEDIANKTIYNMPIRYDITKDALYLQGIEKGIQKGEEKAERERVRAEKERAERIKAEKEKREFCLELMNFMSMSAISKTFGISLYHLRKIKKERLQEDQSESN